MTKSLTINGQCLCGRVSYEVDTPPVVIDICHCSMCRIVTGAAFGTFMWVMPEQFRWCSGEDQVCNYESSPGNIRAFCRNCGTRLPSVEEDGVIVPAGGLPADKMAELNIQPDVHIFYDDRAHWHTDKDLPRFEQQAPDEYWQPFLDACFKKKRLSNT